MKRDFLTSSEIECGLLQPYLTMEISPMEFPNGHL